MTNPSEPSPSNQPSPDKTPRPVNEAVQRALHGALGEVRAHTGDHMLPSRQWFAQLPDINRWLLGSGAMCLLLGLFCLIGVPLLGAANSATQAAYHPYTADGKRETCLSNLQRISLALAQYRQDYDDKFPVAEYAQGGKRKTWVALLIDRGAGGDSFICPTSVRGQSDGQTVGSYGFNPVLFHQPMPQGGDPSHILLLADRGESHDTILLPPFAGWPDGRDKNDSSQGTANLDFRHSGDQAALLYTDGHAASQSRGEWTDQAITWGGSQVFTVGLARLEAQYPVLKQIPAASPQAFKNQKAKLRQGLDELHLLQQQSVANAISSETVGKRLWKGAGVLRTLGDGAFEGQLGNDLNQYAGQLLSGAGDLKPLEGAEGEQLPFTLRYPQSWKVQTEIDGRYRTTHFRSPSPYLEVVVERGERNHPTNATTIDWTGLEEGLKRKYGKGYKRIRVGRSTLNGQEVSLWECKLKKPDGPRLHKRYLGHSSAWNSTILVCTAPVGKWQDWNPVFERVGDSFEFRE